MTAAQPPKRRWRALRLSAAAVLLLGAAAGLHAWLTPKLPRILLKDGRELRVLQVKYGSSNGTEHALGRAPEWRYRVWRTFSPWLQHFILRPAGGVPGIWTKKPMISIWCAAFDPITQQRSTADLLNAVILDDAGRRYDCPHPLQSNFSGEPFMFTEIYFEATPDTSRSLRIRGTIEHEDVTFTIANPAYHRPVPPANRPELSY